jgi:hypothetical protein
MEVGTTVTLRLKEYVNDFVIGATHVNCNTHPESEFFGDCSKRDISEFQRIYYKVIDAVQTTQVIDHGTEASTGWSLFGNFNIGSVLIIAACFVAGIVAVFIMIKCRIPCKLVSCALSSCRKYRTIEREEISA